MFESIFASFDSVMEHIKSTSASPMTLKAATVFLRSVLTTLSSIFLEIRAFCHPFAADTVLRALRLAGLCCTGVTAPVPEDGDAQALAAEARSTAEICLGSLESRTAVPLLVSLVAAVGREEVQSGGGGGQSGGCAKAFTMVTSSFLLSLDRAVVAAHLPALVSIVIALMEQEQMLQSQHHDESSSSASSSASSCSSSALGQLVVDLSLKMTEAELKGFALRLLEWSQQHQHQLHDGDDEPAALSLRSSRSITFYSCVSALSRKFESLFAPVLFLLWRSLIDTLTAAVSASSSSASSASSQAHDDEKQNSKKKKNKKRKHDEALVSASASSSSGSGIMMSIAERRASQSLQRSIFAVLSASCTSAFMDEVLHHRVHA